MEHIWTVICQTAILDKESNNLSLIQTLEQIQVSIESDSESKVIMPISFNIVTTWWRSDFDRPEEGHVNVKFFSPQEDELGNYEYVVNLMEHPRFRGMQRLEGLPFTSSGIYKFSVRTQDESTKEWLQVASIPLQIIREFPQSTVDELRDKEAT